MTAAPRATGGAMLKRPVDPNGIGGTRRGANATYPATVIRNIAGGRVRRIMRARGGNNHAND